MGCFCLFYDGNIFHRGFLYKKSNRAYIKKLSSDCKLRLFPPMYYVFIYIISTSIVWSQISICWICWLWVMVYNLISFCFTKSSNISATLPTVSASRLLMVSSRKSIGEFIYDEIASIRTSFDHLFLLLIRPCLHHFLIVN